MSVPSKLDVPRFDDYDGGFYSAVYASDRWSVHAEYDGWVHRLDVRCLRSGQRRVVEGENLAELIEELLP
jgi:hypothetical protein